MKFFDHLVKFATFAMVGILVLKSYHPSEVVAPTADPQRFMHKSQSQFDRVAKSILEDVVAEQASQPRGYGWNDALTALYCGEKSHERSDGGFGVVGDLDASQGPSYGPYQISEAYWKDSMEQLAWSGTPSTITWENCLSSSDRSDTVIRAYMQRYASEEAGRLDAGTATLADVEKIARIHNGGPKGHTKAATLGYWQGAHEGLVAWIEGTL